MKIEERFRRVDVETIRAPAPTVEDYRRTPPAPDRIVGGSRPRNFVSGLPVFSIITIVRNGKATIERCIESVAKQTYPNIEYVIGDGASTDGTLDILRRYDRDITYWHSEKDRKPEDAFNKMVPQTSGKYVAVLLGDDWLDENFAAESVRALEAGNLDFVFGDVDLYENEGLLYRRRGNPRFARTLRYEVSFNTPSWSVRRSIFDDIGLFKMVNVSPEYDWLLRAHLAGYKGAHDPSIVYNFRFGGNSSVHAFLGYREVREMAIANGGNRIVAWMHYLRWAIRHEARVALETFVPADLMLRLRRLRRNFLDRQSSVSGQEGR